MPDHKVLIVPPRPQTELCGSLAVLECSKCGVCVIAWAEHHDSDGFGCFVVLHTFVSLGFRFVDLMGTV